jgi:hypothetical protein
MVIFQQSAACRIHGDDYIAGCFCWPPTASGEFVLAGPLTVPSPRVTVR